MTQIVSSTMPGSGSDFSTDVSRDREVPLTDLASTTVVDYRSPTASPRVASGSPDWEQDVGRGRRHTTSMPVPTSMPSSMSLDRSLPNRVVLVPSAEVLYRA
jgi:hypothetical protein